MRVRKLLLYFIPLLVVSIVFFGYKNSEVKNTATSLTEAYGTDYKVPTYEPGFIDAIGSWSTGALALSRYYSGGVGYSRNDTGWIYTWGGDSVGAGKPSRTVYRYNVNTNVWSQVAPYPDSIRICASARLGDSLYGMGGINIFGGTAPPVAAMYMYNVNTNTWSTKAPLPQALYFNRAAGYQDSLIYHVGGYTGSVSVNNVYLYNAKTNTWRNATPLPIGTAEGACTIVGDTIVYVGGLQGGVVVGTTYRGVISQSDRSVITWTTGASYPTGVKYRMNAYNWGSKGALVVGGAVSGFTGTNTTYLYSPGANTWTLQQNKPTVICAYQGGVVNYSSGIAKCVIAGGVGSGALTGANEIFTDTLAAPPPPAGDSTLIIYNDSAATTTQRTADRDTLRKYVPMLIGKYKYMTKNTTTVFPSLANYSTIILQETSFDAVTVRALSVAQRTAIKDWLATGTPSAKKSLILIGGDMGYNYDRTGAPDLDTVFSRSYAGYQYILDNGASTAPFASVANLPGGTVFDAMSITPPGTNYWPDGCRPISGGVSFNRYQQRGTTDTLAGISKAGSGFNVVTTFQDPRYFTGAGDGTGDVGFKRVLKNMIAWVKTSGGVITGVEPIGSQIVNDYKLSQNYPNPFNPTTKINFSIPKSGLTTLKVYDILGKEVATLVNGFQNAGNFVVEFDASRLASGAYFYRLEINGFVNTKKMLLIK